MFSPMTMKHTVHYLPVHHISAQDSAVVRVGILLPLATGHSLPAVVEHMFTGPDLHPVTTVCSGLSATVWRCSPVWCCNVRWSHMDLCTLQSRPRCYKREKSGNNSTLAQFYNWSNTVFDVVIFCPEFQGGETIQPSVFFTSVLWSRVCSMTLISDHVAGWSWHNTPETSSDCSVYYTLDVTIWVF